MNDRTLLFAIVVPDVPEVDDDDDFAMAMADEFVAMINEQRAENGGAAGPVMLSAIPGAHFLTNEKIARWRRAITATGEESSR